MRMRSLLVCLGALMLSLGAAAAPKQFAAPTGNTGVVSFNGRTGAVVPASNDYAFAQIGSKPTSIAGYGITDSLVNSFNGRSGAVIPAANDYSFAQLSGSLACAKLPAFTGDATTSAGSCAFTVGALNGVSLASLATCLLKNTTGTGAPTCAVSGTDYVVPGGNVATATALAATPTGCSANQYATAIAASGNLTCAQPSASNLSNGVTGSGSLVLATSPTLSGTLSTPAIDVGTGSFGGNFQVNDAIYGVYPLATATTLNGSMGSGTGNFTVTSTVGYPSQGYIEITSEVIQYTVVNTTTMNAVARGVLATTAATHTSGLAVRPVLAFQSSTLSSAPAWCVVGTTGGLMDFGIGACATPDAVGARLYVVGAGQLTGALTTAGLTSSATSSFGGAVADTGFATSNITGSTFTLSNAWHTVDTDTSTNAALTVTMPPSPSNGQLGCFANPGGAITSLTSAPNTSQSMVGTITAAAFTAGSNFCYLYQTSNTTWYRVN